MKRSAILAVFILVIAAAAQAKAVTVRGQLLWRDGSPASGVALSLQRGGNSSSPTVYTDSRGFFALYNVAPGGYALQINASGRTAAYAIRVIAPRTDLAPIRLRG